MQIHKTCLRLLVMGGVSILSSLSISMLVAGAAESGQEKRADALPATQPESQDPAPSPPPQVQADIALLNSLSVTGWEGMSTRGYYPAAGRLFTDDAKTAEEVNGKPAWLLLEFGCTDAATRQFHRGHRYCTISLIRF